MIPVYSPQTFVSLFLPNPNLLQPVSLQSFLVASSMELMSYNIHANTTLYPHFPPTVLPLDWEQELPESVLNIRERGGFDLIA
jgi:hypothetical protein